MINTVHHLLAQADLIGELEGAGGAPDADGCGPAFKVLRQLALRLLTDAAERHNRCFNALNPITSKSCNSWRRACSRTRLNATTNATDGAPLAMLHSMPAP